MKNALQSLVDEAIQKKTGKSSFMTRALDAGIEAWNGTDEDKKILLDLAWTLDFISTNPRRIGIIRNEISEIQAQFETCLDEIALSRHIENKSVPLRNIVVRSSGHELFVCLKPVAISILDNSEMSIFWTLRTLAGAPNVRFSTFVQQSPSKRDISDPSKWFEDASKKILHDEPDIILLSHGFSPLRFENLMPILRSKSKKEIVFVANTGGDPSCLTSRGAFPNCDKGRHIETVDQALKFLEKEIRQLKR